MYGPLMKKKKQHTRQIKIKNGTTKYNKTNGGSVRLGSKVPFRPNEKLLISCSLLRSRGSVFRILAPLNLKEP